jgi:hypothetical protein
MFLNKVYGDNDAIKNNNKNLELFLKIFSNIFKKPTTFKISKQLKHVKKVKVYKYQKLKQSKLKLKTGIFKYMIGIKKTSTNLYYNVTKTNGRVITSDTKNRVLSKAIDPTQNPNTKKTDLDYVLKAIQHETKHKIKKFFPTLLHVQNFKQYIIKKILKSLLPFYNIKALIITNTNPHNGCRPPKIKTNRRLKFSKQYKNTKVVMTKNYRKIKNRKNPNIIYIPRKIKKKWLSGLKR